MTATCTHCDTTFRNVDRNEDGSPAIESTRCAHPGCEIYLCRARCEHLSFQCDGCGKRFCESHGLNFGGATFCIACAAEGLELEPECECSQTDADLFDPRGCPYHDAMSPWNVRLRAVTAVQQQNQKEKTMNEVVKFQINTPVEVTLQDEAGKRVPGRYGEQVMYSLLDDRLMYVPPYVEQRFQELAIGAGEPLVLCKQQEKVGNRNLTKWSVKRAPQQLSMTPNGTEASEPVGRVPMPGPQPVGHIRETEIVAGSGEAASVEPQTVALAPHQGAGNGAAEREEQPSGNSTAPMAQESALQTNHQHQGQDSAGGGQIALAVARPVVFSTKDSVFLPAMSMEVALARRAAIVEFTRRIMVRDQDFGEIPGTSKPTLLKPGAEKLCNFFGLEPEFTPIVEDLDWMGAQHGGEVFCYARYRCRLLREGRVVGVGEGSSNSWEAKYRYRWVAEGQVPEHLDRTHLAKCGVHRTLCEFEFAIERAETTGTYGKPAGHWQRFRDAVHNGAARSVEKPTRRGMSVAWEIDDDTSLYRVPNPDVADVVNTIQKMAQKRALVAATLIATSASEFFT
jgi:hypothetical protein